MATRQSAKWFLGIKAESRGFIYSIQDAAGPLVVGLLFWFAMKAIFNADKSERQAEARAQAEAEAQAASPADRPHPESNR
jgi:flagellar biosynthesis/type III secretory pathway M-ring protein FliF/YscJ